MFVLLFFLVAQRLLNGSFIFEFYRARKRYKLICLIFYPKAKVRELCMFLALSEPSLFREGYALCVTMTPKQH